MLHSRGDRRREGWIDDASGVDPLRNQPEAQIEIYRLLFVGDDAGVDRRCAQLAALIHFDGDFPGQPDDLAPGPGIGFEIFEPPRASSREPVDEVAQRRALGFVGKGVVISGADRAKTARHSTRAAERRPL